MAIRETGFAGRVVIRVDYQPPREPSRHLCRLMVVTGAPIPRAGETVTIGGREYTVKYVAHDFDRQDDTTPVDAFDAAVYMLVY